VLKAQDLVYPVLVNLLAVGRQGGAHHLQSKISCFSPRDVSSLHSHLATSTKPVCFT